MNMIDALVKRIMKALEAKDSKATSAYDTSAVVTRISGKTAWVHIDGGMPETPVNLSIDCKKGDTVRVRLSGGDAYLVGNDTRPPTDDARAVVADQKATTALQNAAAIKEIAERALKGDMENAEAFAQAVMEINEDIEGLREQIDGNITSWFYSVDPALDRPPVATDPSDPDNTGWDTDEKKNNHLGDLYYNVDTGKVWRFVFTEGAYSWSAVEDSDVTRALEMASRAQDTADSKRRVFVTTPTPPYDVGDLWSQGSGGDLLRCAQAKTSAGTYSRNDWVLATKYTDDSALNVWIAGEFASTVQELENGITDAKVETYYQSADPSTNWTTAQKTEHAGDFWYNTTSEKYYRWSGSAWQEVTATPPDAVFDRIDGKATIYVGSTTPSSPQKGDLWLKSANDDILTYVNGNWVKYNKYTDDTRANAAYTLAGNALTSANGKNKVYHQASQPSGGTYISGDTWFDTDDGYKMYTYNGTSWVAEQFGNAAIADLSISNAKIANATIEYSKIKSLDIGKVVTGKLSAQYIDTASIYVGSLYNDGTYGTGKIVPITTATRAQTYATFMSYMETIPDTWGNVTGFNGQAGDYVRIPCTITDRNNASAYMLVRVTSYSGTTLAGYDVGLYMDDEASKYVTQITGRDGICVRSAANSTDYLNIDSSGTTIYKADEDVAFFGATSRIGYDNRANSGYIEFTSSNIKTWRSNSSKVYSNIATLEWDNYDVKLSRLSTTYLNLSSTSSPSDSEYGATLKAPTINIDGNVYFGGNGLFATFTATGTATISGSSGDSGIACTGTVPSGYTPIAVQEISTNHGVIGSINSFKLRSNGATVGVRNSGSSSQSFTVTAKILCIRSAVNM